MGTSTVTYLYWPAAGASSTTLEVRGERPDASDDRFVPIVVPPPAQGRRAR